MRVRRGKRRAQKRKKILKQAKGFYGAKSKAHRIAREAVHKALGYAYRDRRTRKRDFRRLWIVRINAAARRNGLSYNRLIDGLRRAGCDVDRKMLAELAVADAAGFAALVATAREAWGDAAPEPEAARAGATSAPDDAARAEAAALVARALKDSGPDRRSTDSEEE